jgi:nicotinate-nucleotide pyrophosphorylase (carboxylating)
MLIDEAAVRLIREALAEDIGTGDATTDATIPADAVAQARIVAKESGILAGLPVVERVFQELDKDAVTTPVARDGDAVEPGQVVARVRARTRTILTGERVALNFLQRLSGVATETARYAARLEGTGTRLLDTRKTTPGMRSLEKQAVVLGGGANHRMGLWDMAMIKDNHIAAAGGIRTAVSRVRERHPDLPIEVEVADEAGLAEALDAGVDRVMLDNMSPDEMARAIEAARAHPSRPEIEISGGVILSNLDRLAELGADFVSVGAVTHSAPALDLSLELEAER